MELKNIKLIGIIILLGAITIVLAMIISMNNNKPHTTNPSNTSVTENKASSIVSGNITIDNLTQNQTVSLPMTITGTVKVWFFEGSFPVFLKDANGNQLGVALASSPVDWMTANPIPFTVTLPTVSYTGPGTITFKKDNPSGEAQFDEEVVVNVVF